MVVVPFLQSQGIKKVDTIVVSHSHDDHSGGVRSIVEKLSVGKVLTSNIEKLMLDFSAIYPCQASQQWQWDGVHFQILHPASDFLTYRARDNNYSCVLKISALNGSILLTGDIQKEAEAYLVAHDTSTLDADIVLAPHHGSKTSSNLYFLEAVTPKLAVVSTGYLNRWQFPSAEVTQRYKDIGIPLLNTESVGAITLQLTAKGISKPSFARESMRRYWHE
jgi:competence protein ComEC